MYPNQIMFSKNQHLPENSLYSSKKITNIVIDYLKTKGLVLSNFMPNKKYTKKELVEMLAVNNDSIEKSQIEKFVLDAIYAAFDCKYSNYNYENDTRGINADWINEFEHVKNQLAITDWPNTKVISVGVANGLEAECLFSNIHDLILVDISKNGLLKCKSKMPNSRIIHNSAEQLINLEDDVADLYVSLRTYNSSYFDISLAICEAKRVLRNNAYLILSVANGFLDNDKKIIRGLIRHGTSYVEKNDSLILFNNICNKLNEFAFNILVNYYGLGEIYLGAQIKK